MITWRRIHCTSFRTASVDEGVAQERGGWGISSDLRGNREIASDSTAFRGSGITTRSGRHGSPVTPLRRLRFRDLRLRLRRAVELQGAMELIIPFCSSVTFSGDSKSTHCLYTSRDSPEACRPEARQASATSRQASAIPCIEPT